MNSKNLYTILTPVEIITDKTIFAGLSRADRKLVLNLISPEFFAMQEKLIGKIYDYMEKKFIFLFWIEINSEKFRRSGTAEQIISASYPLTHFSYSDIIKINEQF